MATMFQLCNLLNRFSVPSDPETNMKALKDFLLVLLHAYSVSAAKLICSSMDVDSVTESGHCGELLPTTIS